MPSKSHGMSKTKIYGLWRGMRSRCEDVNHHAYNDYGARGITVCEEWKVFDCFYKDMGDKPEGMSLDRIENDKGYCKENCKWSTAKDQRRNCRRMTFLEIDGVVRPIHEWSEISGIELKTICRRVALCWNPKDAVFKPLSSRGGQNRKSGAMAGVKWSEPALAAYAEYREAAQ